MNKHRLQRLVVLLCSTLQAACAVTPEAFRADPSRLSDLQVCRTWRAADARGDTAFIADVSAESARRSIITLADCNALIERNNQLIALGVGAALLVGAALAASRNGGGGGYAAPAQDFDWEWDQFYNDRYQLVWACRGVQTGQFADLQHCTNKMKTDWKWPGLSAR